MKHLVARYRQSLVEGLIAERTNPRGLVDDGQLGALWIAFGDGQHEEPFKKPGLPKQKRRAK
jgi:hypothetical protein